MQNTAETELFNLFNRYIEIVRPYLTQPDKSWEQWQHFRVLIAQKPLDYNSIYTFISKITEYDAEKAAPAETLKELTRT